MKKHICIMLLVIAMMLSHLPVKIYANDTEANGTQGSDITDNNDNNSVEKTTEESGEIPVLSFTLDEEIEVTVTGAPENAKLAVKEASFEEYDDAVRKVVGDEYLEVMSIDISVTNDDDSPLSSPVNVTVKYANFACIDESYNLYHIKEGKAEKLTYTLNTEESNIQFDAVDFSPFVMVMPSKTIETPPSKVEFKGEIPKTEVERGTFKAADGVNDLTWIVEKDHADKYYLSFEGNGAIPNYESGSITPWSNYLTYTIQKLSFGPGITAIGNHAFHGIKLNSIDFGTGITRIGTRCFEYCSGGLSSIHIPGNVKEIGDHVFLYGTKISEIIFDEGVEKVGSDFANYPGSAPLIVHLPSTMKSLGCISAASGYTVAEDNPYLKAVDGVLYSKDGKTLVDYPARRIAEEYQIPEGVEGIKHLYSLNTKKFVVPSTAKLTYRLFDSLKAEEIYFEDGVKWATTTDYLFYSSNNIKTLRLPENTPISLNNIFGGGSNYTNLPNLTELKIPNGTTTVGDFKIANTPGTYNPGLERIIYDAKNAKISGANVLNGINVDLVIGKNVDVLPSTFDQFTDLALSIAFEGENWIKVNDGAFKNAIDPFNDLKGIVYVDNQGVVYLLDEETKTAEVIVVQNGAENITIPAMLKDKEDAEESIYKVTSIKDEAIYGLGKLKSLTFEAPENITDIGIYAIANCANLESVNGKTTVEDALALFNNASTSFGMFVNTKLTGAPKQEKIVEDELNGSGSLTITSGDFNVSPMNIIISNDSKTKEWVENTSGGGYVFLTGDTASITATISNTEMTTEENCVYRLYVRKDNPLATFNMAPGQEYNFEGVSVLCKATADPNIIYIEFSPQIGKTVSIPFTATYPTPSSGGGGVSAWGQICAKNAPAMSNEPENPKDKIELLWKTKPNEFKVTKKANPATINIVSGGGVAQLYQDISWDIAFSRKNEVVSDYGKDYVRSVDYKDVISLPECLSWKPEIIEAISAGEVKQTGNILYADGVAVANVDVSGAFLRLEDDNVVITWTVRNPSKTSDIGSKAIKLTVYKSALIVDAEKFDSEKSENNNVVNNVGATVHHTYSKDTTVSAESPVALTVKSGNITFTKESTSPTYFGENVTYTINLANDSISSYNSNPEGKSNLYGFNYIQDAMPATVYIKPENMERMFNEEFGDQLTITISNAQLGEVGTVKAVDGSSIAYTDPSNSDTGVGGNTLNVKKASGNYQVEVNGTIYTASSVEEALHKAGYGVTRDAQYKCVWTLHEFDYVDDSDKEMTVYPGGLNRKYKIYATMKSTFGMLAADWPGNYPSENTINVANTAYLYRNSNSALKNSSIAKNIKREAYIYKSVYDEDGNLLTSSPSAKDGDVLEYELKFTHYGKGAYDDLPMVDDLCGSQYLLVPKTGNESLSSKGLEEKDGYYILKEGNYENVKVGVDDEGNLLNAAVITVTKANNETILEEYDSYSGVHTKIKWYFDSLEGKEYLITVRYKAIVDTKTSGANYTIGNVVWMNDKVDDRIYAGLWGGGTIVNYDKNIVLEKGSTPAEDVLCTERLSEVAEGDSVTYRLELKNTGNYPLHVDGGDIADALPQNYEVFEWIKDTNVTIDNVVCSGKVTANGILDNWTIGNTYKGIGEQDGQQYILWSDDAKVAFTGIGTVYIYITLTFPTNTDNSSEDWNNYLDMNMGSFITNTMYVYRFETNVKHRLVEPGKVVLQKGVYADALENVYTYPSGIGRSNYTNSSSGTNPLVIYYVDLYNGGNRRLYIDDMIDTLPKGFTYNYLLSGSQTSSLLLNGGTYYDPQHGGSMVETVGGTINRFINSKDYTGKVSTVTYKKVMVQGSQTGNELVFKFTSAAGANSMKFDDEAKRFYLDRGEALSFAYAVKIGSLTATDEYATNQIKMRYDGLYDNEVEQLSKEDFEVAARTGTVYTDLNDGDRTVIADENGNTWLCSEVTQRRGQFVPGITKSTKSTTSISGETFSYVGSANPSDTVNWQIKVQNTGTQFMQHYTISDILPAPYVFTGPITYSVYDGTKKKIHEGTLVTMPSERTGNEEYLSLSGGRKLYRDGTVLVNDTGNLELSMEVESGNERLNIKLNNLIIPSEGYMILNISGVNPTNEFSNKVYTNVVELYPDKDFETVGQGSMIRNGDGKPIGVRSSAPVTVSFGYSTTSDKSVVECSNITNKATASDPEKTYITLDSKESVFRYTLTVNNNTDASMDKLVLIDNLPEVGDTSTFEKDDPRNSEFKVWLAEDPEFKVEVVLESGEKYELEQEYYRIEYAKTSDFGGAMSNDWKGLNTGTTASWTSDSKDARSIRLVITDPGKTKIPTKCQVNFSFNAIADESAMPGQIAWNGFGYHYDIGEFELEATPLIVGVEIPRIPGILKKLVDEDLKPVQSGKDSTFQIVIYDGTAESITSGMSEEDIYKMLDDGGHKYLTYRLNVSKGSTESTKVLMSPDNAVAEKSTTGFAWINLNTYNVIELTPNDTGIYTYDYYSINGNRDLTYSFVYEKTADKTIEAVNKLKTGSLSVTKNVAGDGGDPNKEFEFTVTLSDKTINGIYKDMQFVNGVAKITLKDKETKTADKLPAGITYLVEEKDYSSDGYTTEKTNESGKIVEDTTADVEFINTRILYTSLSITKKVSGFDSEKKFSFVLTLTDKDSNPIVHETYPATLDGAATTVTTDDEGKISFELKANQTMVIDKLLDKTKYSIKELEYPNCKTEITIFEDGIKKNIILGNSQNDSLDYGVKEKVLVYNYNVEPPVPPVPPYIPPMTGIDR